MEESKSNQNTNEEMLTIKQAAAAYNCSANSLKNNIVKTKKLPAITEKAGAAYMVKSSDVERLLSGTPGIASRFHPKDGSASDGSASNGKSTDQTSPPVANAATPIAETPMAEPNNVAPNPVSTPQNAGSKKSKNKHRRGKGGGGGYHLRLRALEGASPDTRFVVHACLTELASLIAISAVGNSH